VCLAERGSAKNRLFDFVSATTSIVTFWLTVPITAGGRYSGSILPLPIHRPLALPRIPLKPAVRRAVNPPAAG
jgi:hypothetical protein